ncbi:hypothetical protein CUPS4244_08575 [Campylobacter upsaliensis]|uniref:hypothetical protein n=1 Tax=Campylobacter upsaliensis TaxID=28080 RepID=UPI002149BC2F|nr:hypothetical protein [Campylobacter upsaliensis]MCR2105127.1 hypothetical protein [Campylobacter upsaliensis]
MKIKKTTIEKDIFKQKLEESGLNVELFAELVCTTKQMIEYHWLGERGYTIPHYVEPILNLLIELKVCYGASFDFLKREEKLQSNKDIKGLEESKEVLYLAKENKALEVKITNLKEKLINLKR